MKKRFLSILLVVCMVMSVVPTLTFSVAAAEETLGLFEAKFGSAQVFKADYYVIGTSGIHLTSFPAPGWNWASTNYIKIIKTATDGVYDLNLYGKTGNFISTVATNGQITFLHTDNLGFLYTSGSTKYVFIFKGRDITVDYNITRNMDVIALNKDLSAIIGSDGPVTSNSSDIRTIELSYYSVQYTGNPITPPSVKVYLGAYKYLLDYSDYSYSWQSDLTSPGEKMVTVTFKGDFSGYATKTFRIVAPIEDNTIGSQSVTYNGELQTIPN